MDVAAANVERMLADTHSESLQTLITSIRKDLPAGNSGIPALDAQLSSGNSQGFRRGDVVEIQGPAACGKSHTLYHIIITCILPVKHLSMDLGGWGKAALLFDTDGSLNMSRLHHLLKSRISELLRTRDPQLQSLSSEVENVALQCLANLYVFRPTSSQQLATTILSLPQLHYTNSSLRKLEIGILAVDSMSAFYWKDRFHVEQIRNAPTGSRKRTPAFNPLRSVLMALEKIRVSHGPVIVLTNWGLNPLKKALPTGEPASPFFKQHLYPFPSPFDRAMASFPEHAATMSSTLAPPPSATDTMGTTGPGVQGTQTASDVSQTRSQTPLPLTYHITLNKPAPNPFLSSFDPLNVQRTQTPRDEYVVHGLMRIPGRTGVGQFSFQTTETDIVVHISQSDGI